MDETPHIIFLNIGQEMCNNDTSYYFNEDNTITKTHDYYKKKYKKKIEECIINNNNHLQQLDKDINDIERKISDVIRLYSNKKFNSNSVNFIYSNKPIIKYLTSLNTLESQKLKYYNLTLKELKEQHDIFVEIIKKNIFYLNELLILDK
jgi:hypothetical protein